MNIKNFLKHLFFFIVSIIPKCKSKKKLRYGINLFGFFNRTLGLSVTYQMLIDAFSRSNFSRNFQVNDFGIKISSPFNLDSKRLKQNNEFFKYSINIFAINPDVLYKIFFKYPYFKWSTRYNIGYWFWELEKVPSNWKYAFNIVDELWVNTDFLFQSFSKRFHNVVKVPFFINFENIKFNYTKNDFGFNNNDFVFLFTFDYLSSFFRKNPIAVAKAFNLAFSKTDNVHLIFKTINHSYDIPNHQLLLKHIKKNPNIHLITDNYTSDKMKNLLFISDCYVSLHRAEGLGLGMAESMALGKPVIATGYSGNLEFMNSENSLLVNYKLKKIKKNEYFSSHGQFWANPSIVDASRKMELIYRDTNLRAKISKNAKSYMKINHSKYKLIDFLNTRFKNV